MQLRSGVPWIAPPSPPLRSGGKWSDIEFYMTRYAGCLRVLDFDSTHWFGSPAHDLFFVLTKMVALPTF